MNRLLMTTLVVGMVASAAYAQPGRGQGPPQDPASKALDTDGNGTISASEIKNATTSLQSLDSDGDGTIDATEIREAMRASFGGGRPGGGQGFGGQGFGGGPGARGGGGGQARGGGGRGGPGGAGGGGGSRPGSAGSSTLEGTGLKIGQKVPNITIHDDKGGSFPMAGVKGKYTVITFGCLT